MKRAICLTSIILALIMSLTSCAMPNWQELLPGWQSSAPEEKEYDYLLKTVTTHLGSGAVIENCYFYDEQGRTAGYYIYQDGEFLSAVEYGYDHNGYLIYEKLSSPHVDYVGETFSEVDELGRPIAQRYVVQYEGEELVRSWTIEYLDDNGSYIERTTVNGVELTQSGDYDEHGNPLCTVSDRGEVTEYTNEYDEDGRLLKVTTTVDGSSTVAEYEYSAEGDYTIERLYDADGELVRTREYFYSELPASEPAEQY